jgi:hypothetical protein
MLNTWYKYLPLCVKALMCRNDSVVCKFRLTYEASVPWKQYKTIRF